MRDRTRRLLPTFASLVVASLACACKTTPRPLPAPPENGVYRLPFGAVPWETGGTRRGLEMIDLDAGDVLLQRMRRELGDSEDGTLDYNVLAISGGGSRGAYGAGLLTGWTETGTRPEFDVVTGVSTGALMATHAFLGSEFDDGLEIFLRVDTADILQKRGRFAALTQDALFDSTPLRRILQEYLTEEVLDAVAREYAEGRRLFIGTTNLDANAFTIWDMGALATSDRPGRVDRYVDVILASASFPIAFPPVYMEVETDEGSYFQMHVDGAIRENVFYFDFFDDMREVLAELGKPPIQIDVYVLHNGPLFATGRYDPGAAKVTVIAGAALNALMRKSAVSSIYRIWVVAMIHGATFHVAFVRPDFEFQMDALQFDREEMRRLFDVGYRSAKDGSAWATTSPPETQQELIELIDPANAIDPLETRPESEGQAGPAESQTMPAR